MNEIDAAHPDKSISAGTCPDAAPTEIDRCRLFGEVQEGRTCPSSGTCVTFDGVGAEDTQFGACVPAL